MSGDSHLATTMAAVCSIGGAIGYARTRSVPSLVGGVGIGALYAYGAFRLREGQHNGHEICTLASAALFLASAPRARKGPVPAVLTAASVPSLAYYGKKVYDFRQ